MGEAREKKSRAERNDGASLSLSLSFQTRPLASAISAGALRRLRAERAAQRLFRTSPVVEGGAVIFFRFFL